jgi:hypothetical protein
MGFSVSTCKPTRLQSRVLRADPMDFNRNEIHRAMTQKHQILISLASCSRQRR